MKAYVDNYYRFPGSVLCYVEEFFHLHGRGIWLFAIPMLKSFVQPCSCVWQENQGTTVNPSSRRQGKS
jgi:hypothetical protein